MTRLERALAAGRVAADEHIETAIRLADEMVADPTSHALPGLVAAHARTKAAFAYARAVAEIEAHEVAAAERAVDRAWAGLAG